MDWGLKKIFLIRKSFKTFNVPLPAYDVRKIKNDFKKEF